MFSCVCWIAFSPLHLQCRGLQTKQAVFPPLLYLSFFLQIGSIIGVTEIIGRHLFRLVTVGINAQG